MATKKPTVAERVKAGTLKRQGWGISPEMVGSAGRKKPAAKRARNPIYNTIVKARNGSNVVFPYIIQVSNTEDFDPARTVAGFVLLPEAKSYAEALHDSFPGFHIRVSSVEK